jgi:NAD(P)-dependent dehydrogenase (short-subunit alcohol dehydrogenase family)
MSAEYTLITGASSAIGQAIAGRLASTRRLVLHGRDEAKLERLRKSCPESARHILWLQDLSNVTETGSGLVSLLAQRQILVDSLVHCAATLELRAFRLIKPERELDVFAVNVFSAMEIVRVLRRQKPNRASLTNIVLISSAASRFGDKGNAVYTATKGALDAFMKSLAIELAPAARVNSILPGMIDEGMSEVTLQLPGYETTVRQNYPLGIGKASHIAGAAEFLLSPGSCWITGQQFMVDGGFSAHGNHV